MVERNFNIKEEDLSNELKRVLEYIETRQSQDYPTALITLNNFMHAVLTEKDNWLYSFLSENMTSFTLDNKGQLYQSLIESRMLSAIKPNRKIIYNDEFVKTLDLAKEENLTISPNITTIHMFLAILKSSGNDCDRIKDVFSSAGLNYEIVLQKVNNMSYDYDIFSDTEDVDIEDVTNEFGDLQSGDDGQSLVAIEIHPQPGKKGLNSKDVLDILKNAPKLPGMSQNIYSRKGGISQFCTNLNELVENGEITKLIGREAETESIIRSLGRKKKNSVILVGGEGVGKTAIAENIAYKIVHNDVPLFLSNKKIVSLNMTALLAGTSLRGQFEERVSNLLKELKDDGNTILMIDNIGTILADKGKGDYDISSMISRAVDDGYCQIIGTSDFKNYRKTFDKDPSLERKFKKIIVNASTKEETINILRNIKESFEDFHKVIYSDDVILSCVNLATKYINDRNLPDSAIDIIDEAGSMIGTTVDNVELKAASDNINELKAKITECKNANDYDMVDSLSKEMVLARIALNKAKDNAANIGRESYKEITQNDVLKVVSDKTGIPVTKLSEDDKKLLSNMNERLKEDVIGQDKAIDTICRAIKRNRIGLHKHGCMFSCMAIGKTGCGKTLVAKKLAKEMFGSESSLVRFDMSEYPDKTAVNKLIGSNPGYVGYEEGGQLTETVKNNKYCVLLLDEIEKADPEVYNIFLQVLDEGFLTDNSGMKVDFSNVIVIFTSNIGARSASEFGNGLGFNEDRNENEKRIFSKELKKKFPPEFLNRLDNIVYFNELTSDNLRAIIEIELNKLYKNLSELGYGLTYDGYVVEHLLKLAESEKEYGARPIMRIIQDNIEDKITDVLLEQDVEHGMRFAICSKDEDFFVTIENRE